MGNKSECEICGNEAYNLHRREVEGVLMMVCSNCQEYGKIPKIDQVRKSQASKNSQRSVKFRTMVSSPTHSHIPDSPYKKSPKKPKSNKYAQYKTVDNAAKLLLQCRTKHNLSSKEFASSVFIKENYYKRIEKGSTALTLDLAKKFEKKYKLKLVEQEDYDAEDDYSEFLKQNKPGEDSMIYFRKRGQKPEYD